jgi:hypothetical protein
VRSLHCFRISNVACYKTKVRVQFLDCFLQTNVGFQGFFFKFLYVYHGEHFDVVGWYFTKVCSLGYIS